jgi:O-antigen/teichoic acid export membrane protein
VLRESLLTTVLRLFGLAASFLLGVVLARYLGPAQYGLYGLATTLVALAMTLSLLGIPQLAVRELSVLAHRADSAAIAALIRRFSVTTGVASLALAILVLIAGIWVAKVDYELGPLVAPAAIMIPLLTATSLIAAELRGLGHMMKGQWMEIIARPALAFVLVCALLLAGFTLDASDALWIQVGVAAFATAVSWIWIRRFVDSGRNQQVDQTPISWKKPALTLLVVDFSRYLGAAYPVVMMGLLDTNISLGMFRVALACNVVVALPITALHVTLAPKAAQLYKSGLHSELQTLLAKTSASMVAAVSPICVVAYFFGGPLISWVFGDEYQAAWLPNFYLCIAQLLFGLFGMGPILLAMCEGERSLARIYIFSTLIGATVAYPLILIWGATGAAISMIVSLGLIGFLSWYQTRKDLGLNSTFLPMLRLTFGKPREN